MIVDVIIPNLVCVLLTLSSLLHPSIKFYLIIFYTCFVINMDPKGYRQSVSLPLHYGIKCG